MTKTSMLLLKMATAVLAPTLVLAGGEVVARYVLPAGPENSLPGLSDSEIADPDLLWRNRPESPDRGTDGPINRLGFRGAEVPLEKPAGTFRILSLGESTSYGHGLPWRKTYARQLEDDLKADGYPVQVLNGGVRAWTTYQSVQYLLAQGDTLKPDLVLFYHEINDFLPTTVRGIEFHGSGLTDAQVVQRTRHPGVLQRLVNRSRLFDSLRLGYSRWQVAALSMEMKGHRDRLSVIRFPYRDIRRPPPGARRPWMDNKDPVVRVPDADRLKALRTLLEWTRQHHVTLVFLHPAYPVSKPHQCLLTRLAVEHDVPMLDVEDVITDWTTRTGQPRQAFFFPKDRFHPNETGHHLIAKAIAELLETQRLVPVVGGPASRQAESPDPNIPVPAVNPIGVRPSLPRPVARRRG